MRPQGLCLPIISMGVRVKIDAPQTLTEVRISMGPVGPVPWYAEPAARVLIGRRASDEQFSQAADVALENVSLRTSKYRATEAYRETMIRTWLPLILATAVQRAGASS